MDLNLFLAQDQNIAHQSTGYTNSSQYNPHVLKPPDEFNQFVFWRGGLYLLGTRN